MLRLPGQEASRKTKEEIYGCGERGQEGEEGAEDVGPPERNSQKKNKMFLEV